MPIVTKLRRPCKDCGEMFEPTSKGQKLCYECVDKHILASRKKRIFKLSGYYVKKLSKLDEEVAYQEKVKKIVQNKRKQGFGGICV